MAVRMPVKAPTPAPIYSWTGSYVGLHAGYGWGDPSFNLTGDNGAGQRWLVLLNSTSGSFNTAGFVGGGQVGYNWQINHVWVAGLEADINYADVHGSDSIPSSSIFLGNSPFNIDSRLEWFGTVRGRLGILPTDRLLVYATGGLAYGEVESHANYINGAGFTFSQGISPDNSVIVCNVGTTCIAGAGSRMSAGWTLGGGLEWAFANNWTIKAEYFYLNLGSQTIHSINTPALATFVPGSIATNFNDATYNIVRVGLNYHFNWGGPIATRY
jgi:outer membrane immunogenic protein